MRRLALAALFVACASRPRETRTVPAPAASVVAAEDAGAPAPPSWPGEVEVMLAEPFVTTALHQTRTHVVWTEELEPSDTKVIRAIVALDKKTLTKRTIHTLTFPVPRSRHEMMAQGDSRNDLVTTDDAVFLERSDHTLRITLDDRAPIRLQNVDDPQCADTTSFVHVDPSNRASVRPLRNGKATRFPLAIPKGYDLIECQVVNGGLYLFLETHTDPKEWSAPRGLLGRVPLEGGAFETVTPLDGPARNASAGDGAFAFRTRPHADPFFGHVMLLEPGKPLRLVAKTTGVTEDVAVNRTHVCWNEMPDPSSRGRLLCAPRAGGEPVVVVDHAGPMVGYFLLDDDHLMWMDGGLRRIAVPR